MGMDSWSRKLLDLEKYRLNASVMKGIRGEHFDSILEKRCE
jgi:hypothetical protein